MDIAVASRENNQLVASKKNTGQNNKTFQINDMKKYFEKMFMEFEKMELAKIEAEKEIALKKKKLIIIKKIMICLGNKIIIIRKNCFKLIKKKLF